MSNADPSPEELARLVSRARSITEVLSLMGLPDSGGRRAGIRRRIDALGIDTRHFRRGPRGKYTYEVLSKAVAACASVNGVLDYLGIARSGGAHAHISRRIKAFDIDTSHFARTPARQQVGYERFDRAALEEAAEGARSMRDILRRLEVTECGRSREEIRRRLREFGIGEPAGFRRVRLGESDVRTAAKESRSVASMMRHLGLPVGETNRRRLLRCIARYGIDISHFDRAITSSLATRPSRDSTAILVKRPPGFGRTPGSALRRALEDIGVSAACVKCGVGRSWQGEPLTLEVDHINGDPLDNTRDNLRLLCPNCHSQTATFAGRNRGRRSG
jgi:hypothetical protein